MKIESYDFGKVMVRRSQRTSSFGKIFGKKNLPNVGMARLVGLRGVGVGGRNAARGEQAVEAQTGREG